MYLDYYGLKEPPFSITPDPRFVFLSERHRDALAHLLYGIGQGGGGGFVQLTGEVGTGKTTLCRLLLEQLPENTRIALVLNPRLSPIELLETIGEELKLDLTGRRGSLKGLVDVLNAYLLDAYAQGLRVVLIIDEAQNLSAEALEQVRLLTNLETPTQKLLQIILLGQPELRDLLAREDLRQLAQRITARYHLTPLTSDETDAYVRHRLSVAGCSRMPFTRLALRRLHDHAGGVPRLINIIADRSLVAGYAKTLNQIGEREVDAAAAEALPPARRRLPTVRPTWIAAGALALLVAVLLLLPDRQPAPPAEAALPVASEPVDAEPDADDGLVDAALLDARIADAGSSSAAAWNRLLALWTLRSEDADVRTAARCPLVLALGVYCLRSSGSLSKLSTLRRPVILRLAAEGREAWGVLLGLSNHRARLAIGGETFDISRTQLEQVWLGEFHTVWRAPAFVSMPIRRGDSGPSVDWLRDILQRRDLLRSDLLGPAYFDAALETGVRRLQSAHGLVPDGIVGPETLLALTAQERGGPRLRRTLN
jgi:general secretion pathway protein A